MNQYYIIITSTYENIIRVLNIISMLCKSPISFNHGSSWEGAGDLRGEQKKQQISQSSLEWFKGEQ